MTAARAFLVDALQRVADGDDMGEAELEAAIPSPSAQTPANSSAAPDGLYGFTT